MQLRGTNVIASHKYKLNSLKRKIMQTQRKHLFRCFSSNSSTFYLPFSVLPTWSLKSKHSSRVLVLKLPQLQVHSLGRFSSTILVTRNYNQIHQSEILYGNSFIQRKKSPEKLLALVEAIHTWELSRKFEASFYFICNSRIRALWDSLSVV